jgi:hypothetical protein
MSHPSRIAGWLLALALVCASAGSAAAQSQILLGRGPARFDAVSAASFQLLLANAPASMPVGYATRTLTLAVSPSGEGLGAEGQVTDRASRARQNLARRTLAAGAGFTLSAAITPIYVLPNRDRCWGSERAKGGAPLKTAAVVGALGVAMVAGGATWLGIESRRHGYYAPRRQRLIAMAVGAVTLVLGQALQGGVFFFDMICHS